MSKTSFRPTGSRALVQREDPDARTPGGIILSDGAARTALARGRVLAVGPGRWQDGARVPMPFGEGALVVFPAHSGDEIVLDGERLLIVGETEVLGVIES